MLSTSPGFVNREILSVYIRMPVATSRSWTKDRGAGFMDMPNTTCTRCISMAWHAGQRTSQGLRQVVLDDIHIYHIEHAAGSGFAPEHQQLLWQRLHDRGIPYIDWRLLDDLIGHLLDRTIDCRLSNAHWGLDGISLPQITISLKDGKQVIAPDDLLAR